jgi:hypothetical protein
VIGHHVEDLPHPESLQRSSHLIVFFFGPYFGVEPGMVYDIIPVKASFSGF